MTKLRVLDLFSGLGAFSLGLERTGGFSTVAFCEIDPFCRRVLGKHWPAVPCYPDVTTLRGEDVGTIDVICGGFPCQDISVSGSGNGLDGDRSGLWRQYRRLIGELRPSFILVENSPNLLNGGGGDWFSEILGSLAAFGYDAEWDIIPASYVGAPHKRERLWIIAYPSGLGQSGPRGYLQSIHPTPDAYREASFIVELFQRGAVPFVCGRHDGAPEGMDRLHALGNAVVPQIPELIGNAILASIAQSTGSSPTL